jgi:DNA repair protein SbcD/Mre11
MIHSSDWHLGKNLYGQDRLPEQKLFLDWLLLYIRTHNIEYLLLSGDIFDRPIPSADALNIYYQFLADLTRSGCKLFMIGGNHDSGKMLECPTPLFNSQKIKLVGELGHISKKEDLARLVFKEELATFTLLPYFKNHELFLLKELLTENEKEFYENLNHLQKLSYLFDFLLSTLKEYRGEGVNILLAHHLFGQVIPSGSEIDIALCGQNSFSLAKFSDYEYLALGHIHSPHCLQKRNPMAIYSGAPLVYRFGEQDKKSISLIELDTTATVRLNQSFVSIPSWRKLLSYASDEALPQLLEFNLPSFLEIRFKAQDYTSARLKELEVSAQEKNLTLVNISIEKNISEDQEPIQSSAQLQENDLKQILYAFLKSKELDEVSFEVLINQYLQQEYIVSGPNNPKGYSVATIRP